jgi:hypothetical protein
VNVYLSQDGDLIPSDYVVQWVQRSDLAPVPRTLEVTFRNSGGLADRIAEGTKLWTGREHLKYHVVKVVRGAPSGVMQGDEPLAALKVTALLDASVQIGYRTDRAIILENATFGEVYRACGGTVAIGNDFTVSRFSCMKGAIPSFHLARALQEEAGTLVLRDNRVSFVRLGDLFKQDPSCALYQTGASGVESQFLERHEVPSFYSLNDAGAMVAGDTTKTRGVSYQPRTDARALHNMSKVLIFRDEAQAAINLGLRAGDVVQVGSEKRVIMTAANIYETSQNNGQISSYTQLWLGGLS